MGLEVDEHDEQLRPRGHFPFSAGPHRETLPSAVTIVRIRLRQMAWKQTLGASSAYPARDLRAGSSERVESIPCRVRAAVLS